MRAKEVVVATKRSLNVLIEHYYSNSHITGYNYKGDISIDDIQFVNCAPPVPSPGIACTEDQFHCNNNYCIDKAHVCDMQNDCLTGEDEKVMYIRGFILKLLPHV